LKDGKATHEALEAINKAAKAQADQGGIGVEDVDPILERLAGSFSSHDWYLKMADALRYYAERAAEDAPKMAGFELECRFVFQALGREVVLLGVIDRLDEEPDRFDIRDFKMVGKIPSRDELEDELQTGLYNLCRRAGEIKFDGKWTRLPRKAEGWRSWYSVFHRLTVRAPATEDAAEHTHHFLVGATEELLQVIEAGTFTRRTGPWCVGCPGAADCRVWRALRDGTGLPLSFMPSLGEYQKLKANASALDKAKEAVGDAIKARLEEAPWIVEDGFRAELRAYAGGMGEDWAALVEELQIALRALAGPDKKAAAQALRDLPGTVERIEGKATRGPSSRLTVKAWANGNATAAPAEKPKAAKGGKAREKK
jgi:hypothetical protein